MFSDFQHYPNGIKFQQIETERYFIDYIKGKSNELVITFENAENPNEPRPDRMRYPWGSLFLNKKGYCVLGIKPKLVDWYRGECLHSFFRSTELQIFVSSFERVILYGSSMGGFAAMVFSDAFPNSLVIAFNPQTTLKPELTQWEKRYPSGTKQDWQGDFNDAKTFAQKAKRIYVAYDPFCKEDNLHIKRISDNVRNIIALKMPFVGHVMMAWLGDAGILNQFIDGAFNETLTPGTCNSLARKRKSITRYYYVLGMAVTRQDAIAQCVFNILLLEKISPDFSLQIRDLTNKINNPAFLSLEDIPLKSRDNISQSDVSKGYYYIAKRASDLGLTNSSLNLSLKILRLGAFCPYILSNISECYYKLDKLESSLFYINEALLIDVSNPRLYRMKSRILLSLNQAEKALLYAEKSLEIDPSNKLGIKDLFNAATAASLPEKAALAAHRLASEFSDDSLLNNLSQTLKHME